MRTTRRRSSNAAPRRYELSLDMRYRAFSRSGSIAGTGQTLFMSSQYVVFSGDQPVEKGMRAELSIAWPAVLLNNVGLQLIVDAKIVGCAPDHITAQIRKYEFRTRGSANAAFVAVMTAGCAVAAAGFRM